ncbi:MAG: (Fe-S)-binding protein, partial [Bacteroidia bacterium]|nr:(Fe-S)-binding protein [Bacteroidia bacterium]
AQEHSDFAKEEAVVVADKIDKITATLRTSLNIAYGARMVLGKKVFGAVASAARFLSFGTIPMWCEYFPKAAKRIDYTNVKPLATVAPAGKVVYFPSCITRTMGVTKAYSNELEITRLTEKLLAKAGYEIIYPQNLNKLCCGMAFSSKGYVDAAQKASDELFNALYAASEGGKYPILCDMSPCLYTMHTNMDDKLKLYEPAEFITKYVVDKLNIKKLDKKVAVFAVCSAKKLGVDNMLYDLAKLCAKHVVVLESNCCGFAGDHGFFNPELNAHGLRMIKEQVQGNLADGTKTEACTEGYATSRTCEIGLSKHSGVTFKSIMYLLDEASEPKLQ